MTFLHLSVFVTWTVIVSAEQLSYVVTSKPYYIETSETLGKLQRDFHHDNVGENEISETMENGNTHCEVAGSCGGEIPTGNFDATFKPFPQNELEKILRKYGKDKASDRIFNAKLRPSSSNDISSSLPFQPATPENSFDKSKSWSLLHGDTKEDKQADKGWVTLEPVAWSSSQIQKWKPSIQSVDDQGEEIEQEPPHWKNPIASKPQFDSLGWNPNKHPWHSSKPTSHDNSKPDYEYEKPTNLYNEQKYEPVKSSFPPMKHMKPTYDPLKPIYDSLKPTYEPIETTIESIKGVYDKPTYNSIKPTLDALGLTYSSGKPTYESIKTSLEHSHKPLWNSNQNYEAKPSVTKVQPSWNSQLSTDARPQIITAHNQDQFASYLQNQPQHPGMFEQNNQLSMPGGEGPDSDGHWVLLSSTREYGGPDRQRNLSRSLKSKEFYRNAIPLTIYNPETPSRKFSRAIDHSDYKNYIPLTSSVGNSTEYRRRAIPLIITAPHLSKFAPSRHERKLESPQDAEEGGNSRTSRRMVRLTVLPPANGSHTVTSHNGMIEVEDTKLTVDESHRQHLARMMSLQQRSAGGRLERDMTSYTQRDMTSYHPGKVSMMLPGALVRRRRRFEPGHGSFYPRIQTATH